MSTDHEAVKQGIAAYAHEQEVLLRLIRKPGGLPESKFDRLFLGREWKRRTCIRSGITGDSFLLGLGRNGGTEWAFYLDLLQHMIALELVGTILGDNEEIVYAPPQTRPH